MIIHLHIPKNGGQTLNSILRRYYGDGFREMYRQDASGRFWTPDELAVRMGDHATAQAIASHEIRYPLPAMEGINYQYITFLRHPVERIVSLYYFERKENADDLSHRSQASLQKYLDHLIETNALNGWQCRHLTGGIDLERGKEIVLSLDVVGLVERFDASLVLASHRLGLPIRAMTYTRRNVSKSFSAREYLSPGLYDRVLKATGMGVDLYRFGQDLLHERLRDMTRFYSIPVGAFQTWNALKRTKVGLTGGKQFGIVALANATPHLVAYLQSVGGGELRG